MSKKNLPNIPIYIGDWERDCNVLSLETEMAWLKIIFKMHLSGKQSVYKTSTKGLQILWKSSAEKVSEIIEELIFNNICEITEIQGGYEFESRRLKKENELSEIRSDSVKKRYAKDNKKEKSNYKPSTKSLQNTDIEIDYENEIENEDKKGKGGSGEKPVRSLTIKEPEPVLEYVFFSESFKTQWQLWKAYRNKEHKFKYKMAISEQAAMNELHKKAGGNEKTAIAIIHQSIANGWKGFFELKNNDNGSRNNSHKQSDSEVRRDINDAVDKMLG